MDENSEHLIKRFAELDSRAFERGVFCFTEFLSLAEQDLLPRKPRSTLELSGGFDGAERRVARFAPPDAGWDEPFPIVCVNAAPAGAKFAEALSHRDFLGALMGLGVKRAVIGDILLEGSAGYIFCLESIAPFIVDNLLEVRRTPIRCEILDEIPELALPVAEPLSLVVASERLDALIAAVYKLSRSEARTLFESHKVFLNGRESESPAGQADEGDIISVRGRGRFIYRGIERETKKGRIRANIDIFR